MDWPALVGAYARVTRHTRAARGVNGRSVLDTWNAHGPEPRKWWSGRRWLALLFRPRRCEPDRMRERRLRDRVHRVRGVHVGNVVPETTVPYPCPECQRTRNGSLSIGGSWSMNYQDRISIEPGKRGGKPCIRGMRITVYDVLDYLASGMSEQEILDDFPDLTRDDIRACLAFAADRERRLVSFGIS